jgi:hypothetical protein
LTLPIPWALNEAITGSAALRRVRMTGASGRPTGMTSPLLATIDHIESPLASSMSVSPNSLRRFS